MKTQLLMMAYFSSLTGCRFLTPPLEDPIIEHHARESVNAFAVIPSRRMVLIKEQDPSDTDTKKKVIMCAEAPADVSDNLASTLAASLAAAGPQLGENKATNAAAAVSRTLATQGQFLFKRSQGVQLYRDRMYHLCQAFMNGIINDRDYAQSSDALLINVVHLIELEVPHLYKEAQIIASPPLTVQAPGISTSAGGSTVTITPQKIESTKAAAPSTPAPATNQ